MRESACGAADDIVCCCWESGVAGEEDACERIGGVVGCSEILRAAEESDVGEMGEMGKMRGGMGGMHAYKAKFVFPPKK